MKASISIAVGALFFSVNALATNVAIVDSGTYFGHDLLQNHEWINQGEIPGNLIDDDRNGKVDDVVGWNFVEGHSDVFVPSHISSIHPHVYKAFEIIAKIQLGAITEEDKAWWIENVQGLEPDVLKKFEAQLNFYGQYAHGTHCSGVVVQGNDDARILAARVFPDALPPEMHRSLWQSPLALMPSSDAKGVGEWLRKQAYKLVANNVNKPFEEVGEYFKDQGNVPVANYSLGVPLSAIAKQILQTIGNKTPTEEEIRAETARAYEVFEPRGRKWLNTAADTLFVFAAGNDGQDNEMYPMFPASIAVDNAISVAATNGTKSLAEFSNYGVEHVHVAAPGVAIVSTVPGPMSDMMLPMSGTSMAAPYVTMVASKILNRNEDLTPSQVKTLIMETVDKKDWLVGKVATGGLVNADRAYRAAELARTLPLAEAVAAARITVADQAEIAATWQGPKSTSRPSTASAAMKAWATRFAF